LKAQSPGPSDLSFRLSPSIPARIRQAVRSFRLSFRDFIFPPVCLGCDDREVEPGLVCKTCLDALERNPPPLRPDRKSDILHIRALGYYAPPGSTLIHELKYRNRKSLAGVLGKSLAGLLVSDGALKQGDVLVPIPLHPARLRERGYNQSELLARQVSLLTRIPVNNALRRVRNTRSQARLKDAVQKKKNMAGAFGVCPDADIKGKRVILVDDVTTTGATLDSAAGTLKQAGAAAIYALVVARR